MSWTEFFSIRIPHIYFVYGLAFFVLGLAVALEVWRAEPHRLRQIMWPLALFGLIHGAHEWVEMFVIVGRQIYGFEATNEFETFRIVLLVISFVTLLVFGLQSVPPFKNISYAWLWIGSGALILYIFGIGLINRWLAWPSPDWFAAVDVLARYMLAIPGAVLAAVVLLSQRRRFLSQNQTIFANDLLWAAVAFLLYGLVGQFFINPSPIFPSNVINALTFQEWFIIPVQLFRTIMAITIAVFIIRALRAFEFNRQQELATARKRIQQEIAQRDALRQEFLHQVVKTQEEERARIARELHDEFGQMLTGLAIGLRGAQISVDKPNVLKEQLGQLEEMAVNALSNMRHMVTELRPVLLDDMGLPAALRHYTDTFSNITGVKTHLSLKESYPRLPGDVETILFRITQEALTNVARHADASQVWFTLNCDNQSVTLEIKDNGVGFDSANTFNGNGQPGWGIMGMRERLKLADGNLQIDSEVGNGTCVTVTVPLNNPVQPETVQLTKK